MAEQGIRRRAAVPPTDSESTTGEKGGQSGLLQDVPEAALGASGSGAAKGGGQGTS